MYRYGPRFFNPIEPYMDGPVQPTQFRGGPQKGPLSQQGGGSNMSGTMQNPQGQQGGGFGMGEAAGAAGLLSKLGGGASPLAGLPKQAGLLGDPLLSGGMFTGLSGADVTPMADLGMAALRGGTPSLDAFIGAGKGAGEIGSFMGGIAGAGGVGGSPFPAMAGGVGDIGGLLGTASMGPEGIAAGADLGLQTAGQNALGLSNPYTAAAMAVPTALSMFGINIPNPIQGLLDLV